MCRAGSYPAFLTGQVFEACFRLLKLRHIYFRNTQKYDILTILIRKFLK